MTFMRALTRRRTGADRASAVATGLPSSATFRWADVAIDLTLIMVLTAFAFGVTYHPYFFGDELILHQIAAKNNYALGPLFLEINAYKPRLVGNGILALLANWEMGRWATAALEDVCVIWIKALLYGVVRYMFQGDRLLAWQLVATVLTSRYGIVFYYDYSSGLLDLLSTAFLLTSLVAAWLAWRKEFVWRYGAAALTAAVLCIFVHERYVAGLLAAGFAIAIAEYVGASAQRRMPVIAWALALGVVPLLLFWVANTVYGSRPMATGTAGLEVELGWDTLWTVLAYAYNVFLGGNYGHAWLWGAYNYLDPVGRILGWGAALVTAVLVAAIVLQKGFAWPNRWLAAGLAAVAVAMIVVASLPGSDYVQPRWMFPVGILVAMTWIVAVERAWRYAAITVVLVINLIYLALGSHDSTSQVSASRSASSLAASLLGIVPNGKSAIVVGNGSDGWTIGGCCAVEAVARLGDAFSRINLKSVIHVDPFVPERDFDPANYDFGLAYDGVGPNQVARYRQVSVREAFTIAALIPIIEYHHAEFDHYFVTGIAAEIAGLDNGTIAGWRRTGLQFNGYATGRGPPGTSAVCRFFSTAFAPKSSHFYTPSPSECATVKENADWQFEGDVFSEALPTADGGCAEGYVPVYRLYNNSQGGAPNHRYTTNFAARAPMLAAGWIPEGYGPDGVAMCAPQ